MEERKLRVLWICNLMPAFAGRALGLEGTNKEGWIEGISKLIRQNNEYTFAVAFPIKPDGTHEEMRREVDNVRYYGFLEDNGKEEKYDKAVESSLGLICEEFSPDVIQIYGTEFAHCLAMLRIKEWKSKVIVHMQGLMQACADAYFANLPNEVVERSTFRDTLKHDSIWQQKDKFMRRADNEREALMLAEYVCGRTAFDKDYISGINSKCRYFTVNETLRPVFYDKKWDINACNRHTIFVSQGNYPLKGLHFVIEAVARLRDKYKDIKLVVAGDKITAYKTLKDKLKISSYGKYLMELIKKNNLEDVVSFTGQINDVEMTKCFLDAGVFVLASVMENSPNSLGEAMIMGVPAVTSRVGGIPSLAEDEKEVLMYEKADVDGMIRQIERVFNDDELVLGLSENARLRAALTHDPVANYKMLGWVYRSVANQEQELTFS